MADNIIPNQSLPFYYDYLFAHEKMPEDQRRTLLSELDKKIEAAKSFLSYLEQVERSNGNASKITDKNYEAIQEQLTAQVLDGDLFLHLNFDFNKAKYEVEDLKKEKSKTEEDVKRATTDAEDNKKRFHEAIKTLETKAQSLDTSLVAKLEITDPPLLAHFEKFCEWILDIFYDTPSSKFEWDNFRKNVFLADKGEDFKKRIKGLYIPKLYDYQIEVGDRITKMGPLFKTKLANPVIDIIVSLAEDIKKAFDARANYTKNKKIISDGKSSSLNLNVDIQRSDKVVKTSEPYIVSIYSRILEPEHHIRALNLSDFQTNNKAEHSYIKGRGGRIWSFLREDALAGFGKEKTEESKKPGKSDKPAPKKEEKPISPAHISVQPKVSQPLPQATQVRDPVTGAKIEFDEEVQMPDVD